MPSEREQEALAKSGGCRHRAQGDTYGWTHPQSPLG
jgi:hypothetical protein